MGNYSGHSWRNHGIRSIWSENPPFGSMIFPETSIQLGDFLLGGLNLHPVLKKIRVRQLGWWLFPSGKIELMATKPPVYHRYVDLLRWFAVVFWTVPQSFSYVGVLNKFNVVSKCWSRISLFGCLDVIHESLTAWNANLRVMFTTSQQMFGEDLHVQLQAAPLISLVWVQVTTSWVPPTEKKCMN